MECTWIEEAALKNKGATTDFKAEWEARRFLIGGKIFAMLGAHKNGRPILTLKLEPAHGELLRRQNSYIIPGYYMNKDHWNSIYLDKPVSKDLIAQLLAEAYTLVLASLPKKAQAEISALP